MTCPEDCPPTLRNVPSWLQPLTISTKSLDDANGDAIGHNPGDGNLCPASAAWYKVTEDHAVYRAWNATYPPSAEGKWWSPNPVSGSISDYRRAEDLCLKYSSIDRLRVCQIKKGTQVLLGNGQSAQCNQYFCYPGSDEIQMFLPNDDPESALYACTDNADYFHWGPMPASKGSVE